MGYGGIHSTLELCGLTEWNPDPYRPGIYGEHLLRIVSGTKSRNSKVVL